MQFPPGEAPVLVDAPPLVMEPPIMGPPLMGSQMQYPQQAASIVSSISEDEDYTYWRYSKFAIPGLLFLLAIFVTIFCLTAWQARSDIRRERSGVPRDLQPPSPGTAEEGGVRKWKRNMRLATTFLAILFILITFAVFLATLSPKAKTGINVVLGVLLIICSILALICFAFDVNSERDAEHCTTSPTQWPVVCESRETIATLITIFDALLALLLFVAGLCIIFYGKSGDWTTQVSNPEQLRMKGGLDGIPPGMFSNGVSMVRKWITALALFAALACAITLLVLTIIVHEDRARLTAVDRYNRPIRTPDGFDGANTEISGWPLRNTRLRYAVCALVIIAVLLNLIPLNMRVVAYIFAFIYICAAALSFTAFGLDVDAIEDAKDLTCPTELSCVTHPYNAVAALDFLGGLFLILYVVVEYFVCHKKKKAVGGPPVIIDEPMAPIAVI